MDLARFDVESRGELTVLRIDGEVDISNVDELTAAVERVAEAGPSVVVLDLSATTYLDSTGVRLIFLLAERLEARRRRLRVLVPEDAPVRSLLELTGLPGIVPLETRIEELRSEEG
jgi:anti-sigma B factor antagonist